MNLFTIAWKSIKQRALASSLTALSVALGVALMVMVMVINGTVTRMFSQSATGYHLVVGAKGSPMQLVLNTIYFMDKPIENLPYKYYEELKKNSAVLHAIPFNLGDTTQDGRFRIVGTIPEYFEVEYIPGKHFEFRDGKALSDGFEAVIGARVARAYGWKIGSEFPIAHGGNLDDIHAEKFKVVGILAPTGTPNDRAVFIHFDGFYSIAGHEKPLDEARAQDAARNSGEAPIILPNPKPIEGGGVGTVRAATDVPKEAAPKPAAAPKKIASEQKEVTAILLQMKSDTLAYLYAPRINKAPVAQAANPIAQIDRLLRDLVGSVRTMLFVLTVLIIIVSGISIFVSIYNSMADRRREIAIMRALGARRNTVFSIIVAEAVLLCMIGWLVGTLLGHALVFVAAPIVEARSDVLIDPWSFEAGEIWYILPGILLLSIVVGLIPGFTAYRVDVARGLQE
ncbi:MAG: ABC transporter permease [Planctomycetota bacterium]|nr:ABC transporter permease [Planctomycetota bacterium]